MLFPATFAASVAGAPPPAAAVQRGQREGGHMSGRQRWLDKGVVRRRGPDCLRERHVHPFKGIHELRRERRVDWSGFADQH